MSQGESSEVSMMRRHATCVSPGEGISSRTAGSDAERGALASAPAFDRDLFDQCTTFAQKHGWPSLCRGLLNSSEFLYVD